MDFQTTVLQDHFTGSHAMWTLLLTDAQRASYVQAMQEAALRPRQHDPVGRWLSGVHPTLPTQPRTAMDLQLAPRDSRNTYFAKHLPGAAVETLDFPANIRSMDDVPGPLLKTGQRLRLLLGDVLFEAEGGRRDVDHFSFRVTWLDDDGRLRWITPGSDVEAACRRLGLPSPMMGGARGIADCARVVYLRYMGKWGETGIKECVL